MILIVDDDPLLSRYLDELTASWNLKHEIANSVEDAFGRVANRGEKYAIAFIDLKIGDDLLAGLRFADMVHTLGDEDKASVPLVLMTGAYQVEHDAELVSKHHIANVLVKPFIPEEYIAAIKRYSRFVIESYRMESAE